MLAEIRSRYFSHLMEYCCSVQSQHRYVMLSGGIDSFMLLAAIMQRHKSEDVSALVIRGVSTPDYEKALQAASYFGVKAITRRVCMNDILRNARLSEGSRDTSVFQLVFRVAAHLLLREQSLPRCAVYQGDGADSLYGNSSSFVYMPSADLSKQLGISQDNARELLRRKWRTRVMSGKGTGTAKLVAGIITQYGGTPVLPWVSGQFEYVLDVPLTEFRGNQKKWVRDGLVEQWGIRRSIVESRSRCSMQDGLGFYKLLCEELCRQYRTSTANAAVRRIAKGLV